MVFVGGGGHALELYDIYSRSNSLEDLVIFVNEGKPQPFFESLFPIITEWSDLEKHFQKDPEFIIAIGNPQLRKKLFSECTRRGGIAKSLISENALVGNTNIILGAGLNITDGVIITADVFIGDGTLINTAASVHHNVSIGEFCEVSPGARILGKCRIGNYCSIGSNAVILPGVEIGNEVIVGAGAVVTKHVQDGLKIAGVPARPI